MATSVARAGAVLVVFGLSNLAGAEEKEAHSRGDVDWGRQVIRATGAGAPDVRATNPAQARLGAEQAAKLDALRNLLAQVKGIHLSGEKTVGTEMATDEVRAKVEGTVRGFKVVDKRYFSDSGLEIDVEVPLAGVAALFEPVPEKPFPLNGTSKATGLVLDARGLKVTPALGMRVLDAAGGALYSQDALAPKARETRAAASYFHSLDEAKKSGRVGEKPVVIKVVRVDGTDLVLSADDSKKLADANAGALHEGQVAVIFN